MSKKNLYVDVHVLQDVPPANLNRDDTGSPKSARYGGVERLRVSSQAWKRATRLDFQKHMPLGDLGMRTRRVSETVIRALEDGGIPSDVAGEIAVRLLEPLKLTAAKPKKETPSSDAAYLFFFSRRQLATLAERVKKHEELWASPEELPKVINVPEILGTRHSLDVALFGRMVADLASLNVDAAVQVSHALATHASPTQFDYFTAVDDAQNDAETGAGMIGTVEFGSATLYRYATVSVPQLIGNMADEAAAVAGVGQFLRSFITSMPSGKQNTFAAHTRPGLVLINIRRDQPVSYMSAFEAPVVAGDQGYLTKSLKTLNDFVASEEARWGDAPLLRLASYTGPEEMAAFGPSVPVEDLLANVTDAVAGAVRDA